MVDEQGRKPLLQSRGFTLVEDFCQAAGVDQASLEGLVRSGQIEGLHFGKGSVFGIFDDALPTPQELRELGLNVSTDYDVTAISGTVQLADDQDDLVESSDADGGPSLEGGPTWTISWGDETTGDPDSAAGATDT